MRSNSASILPADFGFWACCIQFSHVLCLLTLLGTSVPIYPETSTSPIYAAGFTNHCMGFHEWSSHLCRVPLQQKGWKTLA